MSDCILVVGSTGEGKSTLVSILSGNQVRISGGTCSETMRTEAFTSHRVLPGMSYVDTRGYEDSRNEADDGVFLGMINFLNDNNLVSVRAIVWCIVSKL